MLLLLVCQDGLGERATVLRLTANPVLELNIQQLVAALPFQQHVNMVKNLLLPSALAKIFITEILLVFLFLNIHPKYSFERFFQARSALSLAKLI